MNRAAAFIGALAMLAAACGGNNSPSCDLSDATVLATTDWPTGRHDSANTGRIFVRGSLPTDSKVTTSCIFPRLPSAERVSGQTDLGDCRDGQSAIASTPIIGSDRLVVATADGLVHVLDFDGAEIPLDDEINLGAAANSPLIGEDGSIFVTSENGLTRRFSGETGEVLFSLTLPGAIVAGPNLGPDGVTYSGTEAGLFGGVCTNGIVRFSSVLGSIATPAAITVNRNDPERAVVLVAAANGRVQAYDDRRGNLKWSFFTSARITRSAVVIVEDDDSGSDLFVIGDTQGFVFGGSVDTGLPILDGKDLIPYRAGRCAPSGSTVCRSNSDCDRELCLGELISAAPALGADRVYVATEGTRDEFGSIVTPGAVHAIPLGFEKDRPADWIWTAPSGGEIKSSPALVVDDTGREVLIVGVDVDRCHGAEPDPDCDCSDGFCQPMFRGTVLALEDGLPIWSVDVGDRIRFASPSVRDAQAETGEGILIYIGTEAGHLFEIRWTAS